MRILLLGMLILGAWCASAQTVRFKTSLGDIDVELLPSAAPRNVENFLKYMNKGAYNNSFFHRSVSNFIIQGGGYTLSGNTTSQIASESPVVNEYNVSNGRGTIAMAKLDGDPNSATNQWFFNLKDNSAELNRQNGGFTVFGRVKDDTSLAVMDRIAAVPRPAVLQAPFDEIPLQNYTSGAPTAANYIVVQSISTLVEAAPPQISENGVVTASSFGAYKVAGPGSYLEIYGVDLAGDVSRGWESGDFTAAGVAPTSLEGVSATVGGQRAYVNYVSKNQVNIAVPSTVATNITVPLVLTSRGQVSPAIPIQIKPRAGGLLAPASYKTRDKQFVYASRVDGSAVGPDSAVSGGDTLVFYGSGFGAVGTFAYNYAGQIAATAMNLLNPVEFKIGGQVATIRYQGATPGLVGVYQFNVDVPMGLAPGDHRVEVTQSGEAIAQTLWIVVK